MPRSGSARTALRRTRSTVVAAPVVVGATLVGVLGCQSSAPAPAVVATPSSSAPSPSSAAPPPSPPPLDDARILPGRRAPGPGEADGAVPDGASVFDDEFPAVANLDPELLAALRRAATDAGHDGVEFVVNSGWRSPQYQEHLLREAVDEHGSEAEADRWVSTPDTSPHVSGDAVDIGPSEAAAWLSRHGAGHGLCQIYDNEPWHFELRPEAIDRGCPPRYPDPTHDPRTRR